MFPLSSRCLIGLAALGSAAVLIAALIFQYFGVAPCHLCIWQRWPHLFAAILGAALFALPGNKLASGAIRRLAPLAGAALMLWNTGLAIYHSGVERHIFAGPDSCTSNGVADIAAGDLLAQIRNAPLIRCDEIAWQMFGITMPNLNVIASALFAALWIMAYLRARRGV